MEDEQKDVFPEEEVQNQPKKPYSTPQLTIHGTVEKITGGGAVGVKESLTSAL